MKGKLIVIDGTDGVGKKTQTKLLIENLKKDGKEVRTLDFPQYDKNIAGHLLYEALKEGKHGDFIAISPKIASVIYAFDRMESAPTIREWLNSGVTVVLDRYVSANQIHQGGKIEDDKERKDFIEWLNKLEYEAAKIPRPDLILYLDMPLEVSMRLIKERANRTGEVIDQAETNEKHLRESQERAISVMADYPEWKRIDCSRNGLLKLPEDIAKSIFEVVKDNLYAN